METVPEEEINENKTISIELMNNHNNNNNKENNTPNTINNNNSTIEVINSPSSLATFSSDNNEEKSGETSDENKINLRERMSTSMSSTLNVFESSVNLLGKQLQRVPTLDLPPKVKIPQQPPLGQRQLFEFTAICIGANLLALNAGFINAITFERSGVVVSHVTGTLTKSAMALEQNNMEAFEVFYCIPCFIFGSFFSSMLINYQTFYLGRAYNRVFLVGSLMLAGAAILAVYDGQSMRYVYLTAVVCGMQNSMTTEYSGGVLRTTHCTGTSTDVGIVLARIIKGRKGESWKLFVLIPLLISFFMGGFVGAKVFQHSPHFALFTNVIFFGGTGILYALYLFFYRNVNFFETLFCTTDLENIFAPNESKRRPSVVKEDPHGEEYYDEEEGGGGGEFQGENGEKEEREEEFVQQVGYISDFIQDEPLPITRRISSRMNMEPIPVSRRGSNRSVGYNEQDSAPIPVSRRISSRRSDRSYEDYEPQPVTRRTSSRRGESVECISPYDL